MSELEPLGGWSTVVSTLLSPTDLTDDLAAAAMSEILGGGASEAQIAAFLVALRAKGEAPSELAAMLGVAMQHAAIVPLTDDERSASIDVVGTGGAGSDSVNVSTKAALVVAGAGVPVCKHGNRSASSRCGTADVLEALGVALDLDPDGVAACVRAAGFGFCLATQHHPAFRFAGPVRRQLGVPTAFNMLGPMANPGRVRQQLIGVARPDFAPIMADALPRQGVTSAWVVHGAGFDEITTTGVTSVHRVRDGEVDRFDIDPADVGLPAATPDDLRGGDVDENAAAVRSVLGGAEGPHRDIVLLNAAAALVVAERAADLSDGLDIAAAAIDDGSTAGVLDSLVATSNEHSPGSSS
ncbi:MAG: anthranilate phosphoribosyltransferase [Actinomycetota bacterium]